MEIEILEDGYYALFTEYSNPKNFSQSLVKIDGYTFGDVFFKVKEKEKVKLGEVKLKKGKHNIDFERTPESLTIHRIDVVKKEKRNFKFPKFELGNKNAIDECKYLMEFFERIYTEKIIAGQHTNTYFGPEIAYIKYITGKLPALRGFDLLSYSQNIITEDMKPETIIEIEGNKSSIEKAIEWGKDYKGIVTICWHWFAPQGGKDKTFYTVNTDFDLEKALIDGTPENIALMRDIDFIAKELSKLNELKIPVLWRPLHEADGRWFWWGAKGPENFKKLYYLLYEVLTYHYKLNNLIWVWNALNPEWLVEKEFFDLAGIDFYSPPGDYGPLKFKFDQMGELINYEKPIALTENGPIPDPDILFESETYFLWFMPWWGKFVFDGIINTKEHLIKVYNYEKVITLDKLNFLP